MWPNPQETAALVTFTEETVNGKLHSFVQCKPNKIDDIPLILPKLWSKNQPVPLKEYILLDSWELY